MLKRVLKDGVQYAVANGLFGITHVGLFVVAARRIDEAAMGAVEIVYALIALLQLTVALEVSQATGRFLPEADREDRTAIISSGWWFTILAYLVLLAAALPLSDPIARLLTGQNGYGRLFQLGLIAAACWSLHYYVRSQLRWLLRARAYVVGMGVYVVLAACLGIWLLNQPRWALYAFVVATALASVPAVLMGLWRVRSHVRLRISGRHLRMMLAFSLPLVPSSVAVFLSQYFDRLALARLVGIESVGLYAMGSKLAMLVYLAILGFQGAVVPLVYHEHRRPEAPQQLERVFRWFLWLSLSMLVIVALAGPHIAAWLFPDYRAGVVVVPWLALAVILAQFYIFSPGLVLSKRTRTIAAINLGGAALNCLLNVLLIPPLGIVGAAAATCLAAAVTAAVYLIISQKEYAVPYRRVGLLISLVLAAAFCLLVGQIPDGWQGSVLWLKVAGSVIGMAVLFALLLGRHEVRQLRALLTERSNQTAG